MNIHICHSKIMSHVFEHLWYWICTNIVHINYNMKFIFFCMNLWKLDFTWNLYKPMKLGKFVMWLFYCVAGWCFFMLLMDVPSCCSCLFHLVVSHSSITLLVIPPLHFWLVFFHVTFHYVAYCSLCCLLFFCVAWSLFHCLICCFYFVALLNCCLVLVVLLHCCIA
jgi:hypothetical protein